jgi:hypothetical protein
LDVEGKSKREIIRNEKNDRIFKDKHLGRQINK